MSEVIQKQRNESISLILKQKLDLSYWDLLEINLGSEVRHGITLEGHYYLGLDIPSNRDDLLKSYQDQLKWKSEILIQSPLKAKRSLKMKPYNNQMSLHILLNDSLETWSIGKNMVVCMHRLPLIRFGQRAEILPPDIEDIPAYYGCFVNSKIRYGNLFFTDETGWGLCVHLNLKFPEEMNCMIIERFKNLCLHFKSHGWDKVLAMYESRLAREFAIRIGFQHKSQ